MVAQRTGVATSTIIQSKGVSDHPSFVAKLVRNQAQTPANQTEEQIRSATESADGETGFPLGACIALNK
jgi:hypothetical protein